METGRRALPPEGSPPHEPTPRRATLPDPSSSHPRMGGAGSPVTTPREDEASRRARVRLAVLAVALAVLIVGLYIVIGPRSPNTRSPAPFSPWSIGAASPSPAEPPTGEASPPPAHPSPLSDESTPIPSPAAPVDLGDVQLTVPEGWEIYVDEVVQDDRRLVRLREPATDVRVQVVTLATVGQELDHACRDLVTDQQRAFTDVAESVVVDVPLTGGASGVSCGFTGTRVSDSVAAEVDFTIIRRDEDAQFLVFRDTVPDSVPDSSPVLAQLAIMKCAASETFGVVIDSC